MNREILFRGKAVKSNEWVFGDLVRRYGPRGNVNCNILVKNDDIEGEADEYKVEPETVGQYTGVKDKDGKDIYEWDIVNQEKWVSVGQYERTLAVVKFKSVGFTCECIGEWQGCNADLNRNAIIIGNIYEHPELLN